MSLGFFGDAVKDIFVSDQRSREELIKLGVKIHADEISIPEDSGEPLSEPRTMYVVFAQMAVHKQVIGDGFNLIGDLTEALGLGRPPNPTFHWGILVGDYIHELDYDDFTDPAYRINFYRNKKYVEGEWERYEVGHTFDSDWTISKDGVRAMAELFPKYNLWNNNCQSFVVGQLNYISCGPRKPLWSAEAIIGGQARTTALDEEEEHETEKAVHLAHLIMDGKKKETASAPLKGDHVH